MIINTDDLYYVIFSEYNGVFEIYLLSLSDIIKGLSELIVHMTDSRLTAK